LDTGADEYIIKPCDGPELMARMRAAERLLHLQGALARSNEDLKKANERINKELQDISLIQRSLLPQALPTLPGYRFAAHYQPSTECSGDFYDLLPLGDDRLGIVIGDVSGHGGPAMVAMAVIRMLYRMESAATDDPALCLARINQRMYDSLPTDQYVTMFYGVLDLTTGRLRYSSAGHPPPLLMNRATGQASYLEGCEGFPIKLVGPTVDYDDREVVLPEGHHLLFFTDGVTETFNDGAEIFGLARLRELAARLAGLPVDEVIPRLLLDLDEFRVGCPFDDDLSMMVVSRD
jgi:sigma-B regulation protein RsbU (phosphoserine phosphatase)